MRRHSWLYIRPIRFYLSNQNTFSHLGQHVQVKFSLTKHWTFKNDPKWICVYCTTYIRGIFRVTWFKMWDNLSGFPTQGWFSSTLLSTSNYKGTVAWQKTAQLTLSFWINSIRSTRSWFNLTTRVHFVLKLYLFLNLFRDKFWHHYKTIVSYLQDW